MPRNRADIGVPSVAGGEYFPVLQVGDAVFDLGSDTGDCLVELFLPVSAGLVRFLLHRGEGGGGSVNGVSNPRDACLSQEVTPATLLDHPGVMTGSRERVGDRHEVTPIGGSDLDAQALDLPYRDCQ